MKNRTDFSGKSSFLTRSSSLAAMAVGAAYCKVFRFDAGCFLFTALFLAGMISRIWASLSARNISFSLSADKWRVFPGQMIQVTLSVQNQKLFPVIWLELIQFFRSDSPLLPEEKSLVRLSDTEADQEGFYQQEVFSLLRRYSLLFSGQEISCTYLLTGIHRGIRKPQNVLLRTGDALGLSIREMQVCPGQKQLLVVYPRPVPVDCSLFLQNLWTSQAPGKGAMEDPTLLKHTRSYQYGDSFRRINWRMAALGLPMEVNVQETLLPQSVHFLLDGESYQGENPAPDLLEEAISLIASLIMELEGQGVPCGLSLPAGQEISPFTICAHDEHQTEDLLFELAAYQPFPQKQNESGRIQPAQPSLFSQEGMEAASVRGEQMFLITRDSSFTPTPSLQVILEKGAVVLYSVIPDTVPAWKGISLDLIKGGQKT